MKIGLQLYSLRDYLNLDNMDEWFSFLKDCGYDFVELVGLIDSKIIIEKLRKHGLTAVSSHIMLDDLESKIDEVIMLKKYEPNFKYVAVPYLFEENRTMEEFKKVSKKIEILISKYKEHGIEVIYHNHDFEFNKFNDFTDGLSILNQVKDLKFEYDTHWVHIGGNDVCEFLKEKDDVANIIHLKEVLIFDNKQTDGHIGQGNMNFKGIINVLKEKEVNYITVEQEFFLTSDPKGDIKKSIDFLKGL